MAITIYNYSTNALSQIGAASAFLPLTRNMVSDAAGGGAPPAATDGQAFVVNGWGAGVYVGLLAGTAFADGDIAEYRLDLGGFVRIQAGVAGAIVANTKVIVAAAGGAGSFAGLGNRKMLYDTAWRATAPVDGDLASVNGSEDINANELFKYDASAAGGANWVSISKVNLSLANTIFVDKSGNNTVNTGTMGEPYLTIGFAFAKAVAGQKIVVGPGDYAETLVWNKRVDLAELIPGTVRIRNAVVGGAVFTLNGAVGTSRIHVQEIANTNNANLADVALAIVNNGGFALLFDVKLGTLDGGTLGTAVTIDGIAGAATQVGLDCDGITGAVGDIDMRNAGDLVEIRCPNHNSAAAGGVWGCVLGGAGTLGTVRLMLVSWAPGIFDIGFGAALGTNVIFEEGSYLDGTLRLNNLAGAGTLRFLGNSSARYILPQLANQLYQVQRGANELEAVGMNINLNAVAITVIYPVALGHVFYPHTAHLINRTLTSGDIHVVGVLN